MPKIKTLRTTSDSPTLLDGELCWNKATGTLLIGDEGTAGAVTVKKIQKQITISNVEPTAEDGIEGDIWIQYMA